MSSLRLDSYVKNNFMIFFKKNHKFSPLELKNLQERPRSFWQKQIELGNVLIKNKKSKNSAKLGLNFKSSDLSFNFKKIKRNLYLSLSLNDLSFPSKIKILKETDDFLAINKPVSLSVHQPDNISLDIPVKVTLEEIINCRPNINKKLERKGIVHRLDKETGGVLLIAKNHRFKNFIKNKFIKREIKKEYVALCLGNFICKKFYIHGFLGKQRINPRVRGGVDIVLESKNLKKPLEFWQKFKQKTISSDFIINPKPSLTLGEKLFSGDLNSLTDFKNNNLDEFKEIITFWQKKLLETKNKKITKETFSLLKLRIISGRTHQIRVHLKEIGVPILGDKVYEKTKINLPFHFLMAYSLKFKNRKGEEELIKAKGVEVFY